jgi:hexosaminidase
MSYAKLNMLHWHITDAQSFPINSRVSPELAAKGAWSDHERFALEDVREVVDYARERGISVIPEFDMPGHTNSWKYAKPSLIQGRPDSIGDGNDGALDPTNEDTYTLVRNLLKDWLVGEGDDRPPFFDGPYVHLGTDEVPMKAWVDKNQGQPESLFARFLARVSGVAKSLGKQVVIWEEGFNKGNAPTEAIVQVWLERRNARKAVEKGHNVLLSHGWYLDHLDEGWRQMYKNDPVDGIPESLTHMVLGGEGCMWGETVDEGNIQQTMWPRLGAVAEKLWSTRQATTNFGSDRRSDERIANRLHNFRCLLLDRGVPVGTLDGNGRSGPNGPGSCGKQ